MRLNHMFVSVKTVFIFKSILLIVIINSFGKKSLLTIFKKNYFLVISYVLEI